MNVLLSRRRLSRGWSIALFVMGVALPLVLWLLDRHGGVLLCLVLAPAVWIILWKDLGFVLGLLYFWGGMILVAMVSVEPGRDNLPAGFAIVMGWVPFVLLYGPLLLASNSSERARAAFGIPPDEFSSAPPRFGKLFRVLICAIVLFVAATVIWMIQT